MVRLRIDIPDENRQLDYEIGPAGVRIGRHRDNDIVVHDNRVSRTHVIVEVGPGGPRLKDPGSHNGTLVNGAPLARGEWAELRPGDRVEVATGAAFLEILPEPQESADGFSDEPLEGATVMRPPDQIIAALPEIRPPGLAAGAPEDLAADLERMRRHAERQSERIQLLSRLHQALGSVAHGRAEAIYDRSSDLLFSATPADRCLILLREPGKEDLRLVYSRSRPDRPAIQAIPASRTMTRRAFEERKSVLWSHVTGEPDAPGTLVKHGVHSVMCAPLIGHRDLLGVLYADRQSAADRFELDDLELLNTVAGPTAIAIDNASAFEQLRREELARAAYGRFLPPHLVERLVADPEAVHLGGSNQVVTILFADVRGFTSMAESAEPQAVVRVLNDYFAAMAELVFQCGGTLDKFIGDGLMAIFGAPTSAPDDPVRAVRAAVAMQERMATLGPELARHGFPPISIGIGVNTGEVTVGYIGSERRMDYTAIGDTVNATARLEGKAGPEQIIISQATAAHLGGAFELRPLGALQMRGKTKAVEALEVVWRR